MIDETPEPIDPPDAQGGGGTTTAEADCSDSTIAIDPPDNQGGGTGA